jgi:hypothetical protein
MQLISQLVWALGISLGFLIVHMLIAAIKLKDSIALVLTLATMTAAQFLAFLLLKNNMGSRPVHFKDIFFMLSLTMALSVIGLSFNSAFNPFVQHKPLNFSEMAMSVVIFAGGLSLLFTLLIWFTMV